MASGKGALHEPRALWSEAPAWLRLRTVDLRPGATQLPCQAVSEALWEAKVNITGADVAVLSCRGRPLSSYNCGNRR